MRTKAGNGHNIDLEQFMEDIRTVVKDGEELLKTGVASVKERALAGARTTNRAVREHPYQSLGVVFGVGLLLGVLATALFTGGGEYSEEEER